MDTNEAIESSEIESADEGTGCQNDVIESDVDGEMDDDENIGEEDTMSEYSYHASDDEEGVYNESKQKCDAREGAVPTVGDKRKGECD